MTLALALVLGLVIGVSLGALGGGGSILTVPALVYILDMPARAATGASLIIVGITALTGAFGHTRSGNVRWKAGIVFGLVGIAASFLGTDLNQRVDPNVLLLCFAALMIVAAIPMLHRASRTAGPDPNPNDVAVGTTAGTGGTATATLTTPTATGQRSTITPQLAAKVVAAGLVVGFLTGFLGVGGGFVIVPALVVVLDFSMPVAIGTSLLVIAINSGASLLARAGSEDFGWSIIVPFTVAAIIGSLVGKKVADKASGATLNRAFAGLMLAVAVYVAIRSAIGLA